MDMSKISTGMVVMLVVGLLLGFGLGMWFYQDSSEPVVRIEDFATTTNNIITADITTNTLEPVVIDSETVTAIGVTVDVSNQKAGNFVLVDQVKVDAESWVAVRDWSVAGYGRILGARRVPSGESALVTVDLLRATEAGKTYAVVLYRDNGDKQFDHKTDLLLETNGRIVSGAFDAE